MVLSDTEYETRIRRAAEGAPHRRGGLDKEDIKHTLRAAGLSVEGLRCLGDYHQKLRDNLDLCIECNIDPFPTGIVVNGNIDAPAARVEVESFAVNNAEAVERWFTAGEASTVIQVIPPEPAQRDAPQAASPPSLMAAINVVEGSSYAQGYAQGVRLCRRLGMSSGRTPVTRLSSATPPCKVAAP